MLISSVRRERVGEGWGKEKGWEVMLVRFGEDWDGNSRMEVDSGAARKLEVLWTLRGEDVPLYVNFSSSSDRFLLGSSSHYSLPPNLNINPTTTTTTSSTPSPPPTPPPQAPFSWTQTSSTVTITFPSIPSKPTNLTLASSQTLSIPSLLGFSSEDNRTYWDRIKPSESTWTYESESGTLTLELEKGNEKTRWSELFVSQTQDGSPSLFEEVSETLSIEQSAAIAENLAKFTSSFQEEDENDDASGGPAAFAGLDSGGMSSLMRQEMDLDDEEEQEGMEGGGGEGTKKEVKWTFVGKEDGKVEKLRGGRDEMVLGKEMVWAKGGGFEEEPKVLVKGSVSFSFRRG